MDQSMNYILSGCPMLEELTLQLCYCHRRVVLLNSNLKTLKLDIRWFQPRIHVSCPTLLSFDMSGAVEVLDIANVASIAEGQNSEAMLLACSGTHFFSFFITSPGNFCVAVEQSTISNLQLQIPSSSIGFCDMAPTRNTELAEALSLLGESYHRNYFLRWIYTLCMTNFNCFIVLVAICVLCNNALSWIHLYEFDVGEYWSTVDVPVQCLIDHLKTVEVAGFVMEKQMIQFLEYLLGHSMVLQKMKIFAKKKTSGKAYETSNPNSLTSGKAHETSDPNSLTSDKAHEYKERLLNAPKASAAAAVFFY
ncbi:hypothetical protein RDI58_018547 [Solanum bulbocastanum]|uniref:FBD domain-containing protein n=1 Tax=Solanum bulbocastanum TaxID=147425 RepID=A0AAN8THI6_SOLBU